MQLCATETRTVVQALRSPGPEVGLSQTVAEVVLVHSSRTVSHSGLVWASRPVRTQVPATMALKASPLAAQKSTFSESVRSLSFLSAPAAGWASPSEPQAARGGGAA